MLPRSDRQKSEPERRRSALAARGVPADFIEPIATRGDDALTWGGGLVLFLLLLLAVMAPIAAGVEWLQSTTAARAAAMAKVEGAWLIDDGSPTGLTMLGLTGIMIAAVCATGWIFASLSQRVEPHPAPHMTASSLRGKGNSFSSMMARRSAKAAAAAPTEMDFLRWYGRHQARMWRRLAVIFLIPGLAALLVNPAGFAVAGPAGLSTHDAWGSSSYRWSDLSEVAVGCRTSEGGHRLIYRVRADGAAADLGGMIPAAGGDVQTRAVFEALESVDRQVRAAGVRRAWASPDGGDAADPDCLAHWAEQVGEGGQGRVGALLTTGP